MRPPSTRPPPAGPAEQMWGRKAKFAKAAVHIPCWNSFRWNPLRWRGIMFGRWAAFPGSHPHLLQLLGSPTVSTLPGLLRPLACCAHWPVKSLPACSLQHREADREI